MGRGRGGRVPRLRTRQDHGRLRRRLPAPARRVRRDRLHAPHPTGRRVTRFNALPGTRVFVAKDGRRVVGTVTLVQDSAVGLPMDQMYRDELAGVRAQGRRLGEASTLTVDRAYRASGIGILMRLYRVLSVHALGVARLDDLCMVVRPHHVRFYETFFPFRRIGPTRPYPRLEGAPFVGFRADLRVVRAVEMPAARAGLLPGTPYEFLFASRHYDPVLDRLRRDRPGSTLTPDQVAHFFAGHGVPEAAPALEPALTA
ncbi:MAG: N-acyl amino acid synthase FeeM domain-containing protein [Candidatus Rokuibacteriota bacterium]